MPGDDDLVGGEVKTPKPFVIFGITEEDALGGPWCEFVRDGGGKVWVAPAAEGT